MAKATAINESLVEKNPHDSVLRQGLLHTYLQSSQLYEEVNDPLSFEILHKALKLSEELMASDAANTQARQNLAKTYSKLGTISVRLKKLGEAVYYLERAAATFAELEGNDPRNGTYRHDIGRVFTYLGLAKYEQRDFTRALAWYEKAAEVFETAARADAKNTFSRRKLAGVYTYIGDAHRDWARRGQNHHTHRQAAKENYQRALDIFLQLQAQNALAEFDRKYLEEVQAAVRKYEQGQK